MILRFIQLKDCVMMVKNFIFNGWHFLVGRSFLRSLVSALLLFISTQSLALTPFVPEEGISYFSKAGVGLYRSNLLTGVNSLIYPTTLILDAVAYNPLDNFIYAKIYASTNFIKIGSDGDAVIFSLNNIPADFNYAIGGDFDTRGNYYLYQTRGALDGFLRINIATGTSNFVAWQYRGSQTGPDIADFAISTDGSLAYSVTSDGNLYVIMLYDATCTFYHSGVTNLPNGDYNVYLDNDDNMFVQLSETGDTYFLRTTGILDLFDIDFAMIGKSNLSLGRSDGTRAKSTSLFSTSPQPNFTCQNDVGFVLQSSGGDCNDVGNDKIYQFDVKANTYLLKAEGLLGELEDGTMNALAFNSTDRYLWTYRRGTNELLRIGSDWSVRYYYISQMIPPKPPDWFNSGYLDCLYDFTIGDIDKNGIMHLLNTSNELITVDLNPASRNYLFLVGIENLGAILPDGSGISDFAFNPVDGLLYSITTSMHLVRIDPVGRAKTDLGKITAGNSQSVEALFFNASGDLYFQGSSDSQVYSIRKTHFGNKVASLIGDSFKSITLGDAASCTSAALPVTSVSGRIWDDANANIRSTNEVNTITDDPNQTLTIYLTDDINMVIAKTNVAPDGTWQFTEVPQNGTYEVTLSNDRTIALGKIQPAFASNLPPGWVSTGIDFPTSTVGSAWHGTVYVATTPVTHADFGIQKVPSVDNKSFALINEPFTGESIVLNGSRAGSSPPTELSGADYEDGTYDGYPFDPGAMTKVIITSLPVPLNGSASRGLPELYYRGGPVTAGTVIDYYFRDYLSVKLNGVGYKGFQFTYQMMDAGGQVSNVGTYRVTWQTALPVKLITFVAGKEQGTARLSWATSEEINADNFKIERSTDAKSWKYIGEVQSTGESRIRMDYYFIDASPLSGMNYYRLKMTDRDSSYAYSRIQSLDFINTTQSILLYPNPASDKIIFKNVTKDSIKGVSIRASNGNEVYQTTTFREEIDVSGFHPGIYIVTLTRKDGFSEIHKIVLK